MNLYVNLLFNSTPSTQVLVGILAFARKLAYVDHVSVHVCMYMQGELASIDDISCVYKRRLIVF